MKGYDDFLSKPDPIGTPFAVVPHWLIGKVTPAALEVYAHVARRAGPDGWCWFTKADFDASVRTIRKDTYRASVDRLEAAGAVVVFWLWRTSGDHAGRNGGFAFYRGTTLTEDSLVGPLEVEIPTRVPGVLTPRRDDVLCHRIGSDVIRTSAHRAPKARERAPGSPPRARLVPLQRHASVPAEVEPLNENPLVEQEPAAEPVASLWMRVPGLGCVA